MLRTQRTRFLVAFVGILILVVLACNMPQGEMQTSEALTSATTIQLSLGPEKKYTRK